MRDPVEFGTTAITKRELRNTFLGLAGAVILVLLFGVGLAMRLRSSADVVSEGPAIVSLADTAGDPTDTRLTGDPVPGVPVPGDSVFEQLPTVQAVLPAVDGANGRPYGIRVGIFAVPENADRMLIRLQAEGYAPFVVFHRSDARTLRYVYAATAGTEAEAESLAVTVRDALGMTTHVETVDPTR